jgi:hypothetical protein
VFDVRSAQNIITIFSIKMSVSDARVRMDSGAQSAYSYQSTGSATIALGAATVAVADTRITANSLVFLQLTAADATATRVIPALNAGVGFTITANANATAATGVSWWIARF